MAIEDKGAALFGVEGLPSAGQPMPDKFPEWHAAMVAKGLNEEQIKEAARRIFSSEMGPSRREESKQGAIATAATLGAALLPEVVPSAGIITRNLLSGGGAAIGQEAAHGFMGGLNDIDLVRGLKTGLLTAGAGVAGEYGTGLAARGVGALTTLPNEAITETLPLPTSRKIGLMRSPGEMEASNLGNKVIGRIESDQALLPQMRQDYSVTPYELSQRREGLLGKQASTQANINSSAESQIASQQEATRLANQQASQGKRIGIRGANVASITGRQTAREMRDSAIGNAGRQLDSTLGEAEHSLTGAYPTKMALLNQAKADGVTIDMAPIIKSAEQLIPVKPTTSPRQAAQSSLQNWIDSVKQNYTTADGSLTVDPLEADRILSDLRAVSPKTYGDINQAESGRLFHQLQLGLKNQIYSKVLGSGQTASDIYRVLNAREGLRNYLSEDNPSGFVKQIVAGGPGARDRLMALREFEQTHGTGGQYENQVNQIRDQFGGTLKNIGVQHREAVDKINADYTAQINKTRSGDIKARNDIISTRDKKLAALEVGYKKKLDEIGIQQDLQAGRREQAFNKQTSTPWERQSFEAQENLRKYISAKNPADFVNAFRPGSENQDTVAALRSFERNSGTGGAIERELRSLALKKVWTDAETGRAFSLWRGLEKMIGKPVTKVLTVGTRPIGRSAAATAAFLNANSQDNK